MQKQKQRHTIEIYNGYKNKKKKNSNMTQQTKTK